MMSITKLFRGRNHMIFGIFITIVAIVELSNRDKLYRVNTPSSFSKSTKYADITTTSTAEGSHKYDSIYISSTTDRSESTSDVRQRQELTSTDDIPDKLLETPSNSVVEKLIDSKPTATTTTIDIQQRLQKEVNENFMKSIQLPNDVLQLAGNVQKLLIEQDEVGNKEIVENDAEDTNEVEEEELANDDTATNEEEAEVVNDDDNTNMNEEEEVKHEVEAANENAIPMDFNTDEQSLDESNENQTQTQLVTMSPPPPPPTNEMMQLAEMIHFASNKTFTKPVQNVNETIRIDRFVFIHIGKTGGSTARCILKPSLRTSDCRPKEVSLKAKRLLRNITKIAPIVNLTVATCHIENCNGFFQVPLKDYRNTYLEQHDLQSFWVNHFYHTIVAIRNPVERIKSWFYYERKIAERRLMNQSETTDDDRDYGIARTMFVDCYVSLEVLLLDLKDYIGNNFTSTNATTMDNIKYRKDGVTKQQCQQSAYMCLTGQAYCLSHNIHNYRFYFNTYLQLYYSSTDMNTTLTKPKIYLVRNEYKWDDWVKINENVVQQTTDSSSTIANTKDASDAIYAIGAEVGKLKSHGGGTNNQNAANILSTGSRTLLCSILCEEINIYKFILLESTNLSNDDVVKSIQEVNNVCEVDTSILCPYHLFDQTLKQSHEIETRKQNQ